MKLNGIVKRGKIVFSDLDERPSATSGEKEEDKAKATESETGGTRATGDEIDSEDVEESADRDEEKSDDQEQEE